MFLHVVSQRHTELKGIPRLAERLSHLLCGAVFLLFVEPDCQRVSFFVLVLFLPMIISYFRYPP